MGGRLVVGVDGSVTATLAVRWAAREAKLRGATLDLISVWEIPTADVGFAFGYGGVTDEILKGIEESAAEVLAKGAEAARDEAPGVQVETRAVQGQAADVLVSASGDADLLVVGSRGMGGFRELLLGSTSQQCAHHAICQVVIVRHLDPAA